MKKWSEIKSEPVTWGGIVNLVKGAIVIACIIYNIIWLIAMIRCFFYDAIVEKIENFTNKAKKVREVI